MTGNDKIMIGQIRSDYAKFPTAKFTYKNMPILFSFVSGLQKCYLFFVQQLEMPKTSFQVSDVITFTWFLAITQLRINMLF